jgi:hypothetical protein
MATPAIKLLTNLITLNYVSASRLIFALNDPQGNPINASIGTWVGSLILYPTGALQGGTEINLNSGTTFTWNNGSVQVDIEYNATGEPNFAANGQYILTASDDASTTVSTVAAGAYSFPVSPDTGYAVS